MTCSLSWYRRDEDGRRQQIEFKLIKEKATWHIHRERFEPREVYQPEDADWEALLDLMRRNLRRGNVYPEDVAIVERLWRRERDGY
jgi:hypothetical protein